jgi:hypothetical protein
MPNMYRVSPMEGELYLAGERVPPGIYRQVGGTREVHLETEDYLPASLDGRIACYERVLYTWGQHVRRPMDGNAIPLTK